MKLHLARPVRSPRLQFRHFLPLLLLSWSVQSAAPPTPADGVRDDARLLSDAARDEIAQEITNLRESAGLWVMVDTETFLPPDVSPQQRIRVLRDTWLGDKPGLVVSMTRRTEGPPLVDATAPLWQRHGEPHVYAMLQRAANAGTAGATREEKLLSTLRSLLADLRAAEARSQQKEDFFQPQDIWLAAGLATLLAFAALLTIFAVRHKRRTEARRAAVKLLPDVIMPTRLGAPGGGGTVVERSYRK